MSFRSAGDLKNRARRVYLKSDYSEKHQVA